MSEKYDTNKDTQASSPVDTPHDRWLMEQELCRTRLDYLCQFILQFKDWDACHDDLMEWREKHKDRRFRLILMPRGHLKSSVITVADTIQQIVSNPDLTCLITSDIWTSAKTFLFEIKEHLTKSALPSIFGSFRPSFTSRWKWSEGQIVVNQRRLTQKSPTIDTGGLDKGLTSQHYNLIKADDIVTRQNVGTTEQITKVKTYLGDLIKLLEPDGIMEVIGTRWHDADCYGHIEKILTDPKLGGDAFVVYKRKAVESGVVIFPKKFSIEKLANIKMQIGTTEYSSNFDNEPLSSEDQVFKGTALYWTDLGDGAIHAITFDPATSEKKTSCDAVVMDSAITKSNQLCVVEYAIFKGSDKKPDRMIDKIFSFVQTYRQKSGVIRVGVETNGGQEIYLQLLQEEQRKRNLFFEIVPIHQHVDKSSRIRALQPRWESGNLLLKQGMTELEEQLTRFPIAEKVDILDALAMQLQVSNPQHLSRPKVWVDPAYK